jgi:hypothetical protein
MKRLVAALLALALAGCFPAFTDNAVVVETPVAPWTHAYSTAVSGVFVASSSAPITAFEGPGCELRDTRVNGPRTALVCNAPGSYRLQTRGSVSTGVVR